jgi:nitrate/nitrite transport system ATP-binding protein
MSSYLDLSQVTKCYGPAVIVEDFTLKIERGEFVSIIGHSGCGKSTVLSMIAGLTDITGGGIALSGKQIIDAGPDRGVVFQSPCLLPWLTAIENVLLGVDQVYYTATPKERRELAEYYLSLVGLGSSFHKRPAELSQGMRQRVGLARAFALSPKMLLLDEPFGMLDSLTRAELQDVLLEMWQRLKITALIITHDVDEALFLSDRVVCMTDGPAATVGDILEVKFPRPRSRAQLLEDPEYYRCREHLITFLEERSHLRPLRNTDDDLPPLAGKSPSEPVKRPLLTHLQQNFSRWSGRRAAEA